MTVRSLTRVAPNGSARRPVSACIGLAALLFWAGAGAAKSPLPTTVTDNMYVTLAEVRANSQKVFESFGGGDLDPITKQQFVTTPVPARIMPDASHRKLLGQLFERLDADGDDRLTHGEWRARIDRDLAFADANDDGRITLRELANARANMSIGDALGLAFWALCASDHEPKHM